MVKITSRWLQSGCRINVHLFKDTGVKLSEISDIYSILKNTLLFCLEKYISITLLSA